ncbi:MAG: archease [Gemmataceae bacterium]|nr:archease [Gemmataceae bacterium]
MFEFFDHTADLGLRVRAATLDALLSEAGRALTAAIVEDPATILPATMERIEIAGTDPVYLMFDWLNELLYRFEGRRMLFREFRVNVGPEGLVADVVGEPFDAARHPLQHEVKAITYHGLRVDQEGGQWTAEVIVDI